MRYPIVLALIAFVVPARAQDEPSSTSPGRAFPLRVGAYGTASIARFSRWQSSPGDDLGFGAGGQASLVFGRLHGVRFGVTTSELLFGPHVTTIDLAYSIQWSSDHDLRAVTTTVGLFVGPSVGFLQDAQASGSGAFVGAGAGVFGEVHVWWFTLGMDLSYRIGAAVTGPSSVDGAATFALYAGLTFDLPVSQRRL